MVSLFFCSTIVDAMKVVFDVLKCTLVFIHVLNNWNHWLYRRVVYHKIVMILYHHNFLMLDICSVFGGLWNVVKLCNRLLTEIVPVDLKSVRVLTAGVNLKAFEGGSGAHYWGPTQDMTIWQCYRTQLMWNLLWSSSRFWRRPGWCLWSQCGDIWRARECNK